MQSNEIGQLEEIEERETKTNKSYSIVKANLVKAS